MRDLALFLLLLTGPLVAGGCSHVVSLPVEPVPAPAVAEHDDPPPQPVPVPEPAPVTTEADYWSAMAELVESGVVTSTDTLLQIAHMLRAEGRLVDIRRTDAWIPARVTIDESNRAAVAATLRGE